MNKVFAALLLSIWAFPVFLAGHEMTHCLVAEAAGSPFCIIQFGPEQCDIEGLLGHPAIACATHKAQFYESWLSELIAHCGGIVFVLSPVYLLKKAIK